MNWAIAAQCLLRTQYLLCLNVKRAIAVSWEAIAISLHTHCNLLKRLPLLMLRNLDNDLPI
jgi:hypothetical protein